MSSPPTSRSPEGRLRYEAVGYASIEFAVNNDGEVSLFANPDGLRSLARLLDEMSVRLDDSKHIHLTPSMQLSPTSRPCVVARRDGGPLPDGSDAPDNEGSESDA